MGVVCCVLCVVCGRGEERGGKGKGRCGGSGVEWSGLMWERGGERREGGRGGGGGGADEFSSAHASVQARAVRAADYGRPCPCGHDPHGRVSVHTALKNPPLNSPTRQ